MARIVLSRRARPAVWVQDLYSQGMEETGEGAGLAARIARVVEKWTLRRAGAVVAIHTAMAARIQEDLGVNPQRIHVIPNWTHITAANVDTATARRALGWPQEEFIVLHAGNQGRKQGLGNVVEAARLSDSASLGVVFVLLGDGAERATLEAAATDVQSIRFIDPLSSEQFPLALAAADVLLVNELPGVKEMAVPSKLTSYFAAGKPVIAASEPDGIVGAIMATAKAGPVAGTGDPKALLKAVVALREDPDAAAAAGSGARDYWTHHLSAEAALTAWSAVIDNVTARQ
jgi:glycosyltransferase involved in cell wall biosynthesis